MVSSEAVYKGKEIIAGDIGILVLSKKSPNVKITDGSRVVISQHLAIIDKIISNIRWVKTFAFG